MSEPPSAPTRVETSPWGAFAWGFTDVTAVAFVALGLVVANTRGAAPLAFLLGGLGYVLVGLGYTELASAYPIAGGAQHFVVRGLGDLIGFLAGAALLFDFTINLALFAVAAAGQLDTLFDGTAALTVGSHSIAEPRTIAMALLLIAALAVIHVAGFKRSSLLVRILAAVGLALCAALVIGGFAFAWDPAPLAAQWQEARSVEDSGRFAWGVTLVMISFVGLESIAQVAHETRRSATLIPRAALTLVFCVLAFGVALAILAMGLVPWASLANHAPLPSLVRTLPVIGEAASTGVALLGAALLSLAAAGALRGITRLISSMGQLRLAAGWLAHAGERKTPARAILVFALLAAIAVAGASLTDDAFATLADLYAFGTTLAYALMLLALIRLRFSDPHTPRPYKLPFNLPMRGRSLPLVAALGLAALAAMFSTVAATHRLARLAAPLWLGLALLYYILSRRAQKLPLVGSLPRNWDEEQLASLAAAQEFDLLEQYKRALAERERARVQ